MKRGEIFIHPDKLGFYVLNKDIGDILHANDIIAFGNVEPPVEGEPLPEWFEKQLMLL